MIGWSLGDGCPATSMQSLKCPKTNKTHINSLPWWPVGGEVDPVVKKSSIEMSSCRGTERREVLSHTLIFTSGGIKRRKSSSRLIPFGSIMTIRTQTLAIHLFSLQISWTSSKKAEGFSQLPLYLISLPKEAEDYRGQDPNTGDPDIRVKKKMISITRVRMTPMKETRSIKLNLLGALISDRILDRLPKEWGWRTIPHHHHLRNPLMTSASMALTHQRSQRSRLCPRQGSSNKFQDFRTTQRMRTS